MLATLAFLPSQNIGQVFAAICDRIRWNFGDVTEEMLVYFEGTYIGSFCVDAPRGDPLFSMELRNMFHRNDAMFQRTNNRVEGWQRSFQGHLPSCHPGFWKFLQMLKNEQSVIYVDILQQSVVKSIHHKEPVMLIATLS